MARFRCPELRRALPALGGGALASAWWVKPTLTEGVGIWSGTWEENGTSSADSADLFEDGGFETLIFSKIIWQVAKKVGTCLK